MFYEFYKKTFQIHPDELDIIILMLFIDHGITIKLPRFNSMERFTISTLEHHFLREIL